jgi:hypothetical protein
MFWFESSIQAMTPYFLVGRGLVLFAGAFGMFSLRTTRVKGLAAIRRGYDYELLVASGNLTAVTSPAGPASLFFLAALYDGHA